MFVADAELQSQADAILESVAASDSRIGNYLDMHNRLLEYNDASASTRNSIQRHLDDMLEKYANLDQDMSIADMGVVAVNRTLFDYLVVRAYYAQNELEETLLDESASLHGHILSMGFKNVYQLANTNTHEHVTTRYYYSTENGYVQDFYYSITTLENGEVEYMSVPLAFRYPGEDELESYASMGEEERAKAFMGYVKLFVERTNLFENPVLNSVYTEEELAAFHSFLDGLTVEYINECNITVEEEPYSNKQLLVELGDTRFVLRITVYGLFMDVIQHKDYYDGRFMRDLAVLRQAYLGEAPVLADDSAYIVIEP